MSTRKYRNLFNIVTALFAGILIGYVPSNRDVLYFLNNYQKSLTKQQSSNPVLITTGKVSTCFTPPAGCSTVIANEISKAQHAIYVQAYGFTSKTIATALINAKRKGVKVMILLDKSNIDAKHSKMNDLKKAGIAVLIDNVPGIAHNKVIIIDEQQVITGSFNFTTSADTRNAENVIMINDTEVAKQYLSNWFSRYEKNQLMQDSSSKVASF